MADRNSLVFFNEDYEESGLSIANSMEQLPHNRKDETEKVDPAKIIIIEGILILAIPKLRELFDVKVFVDTDDDERLLRRIERDLKERGRSFDSIKEQYIKTVKPMHLEFVEPSKRYADIIIPRGGENKIGIKMVATRLRHLLGK